MSNLRKAKSSGYLIQSSFGKLGNFEVVAPVSGAQLQHFYRNNDVAGAPWIEGPIFAIISSSQIPID
jgi:hypothetical protein